MALLDTYQSPQEVLQRLREESDASFEEERDSYGRGVRGDRMRQASRINQEFLKAARSGAFGERMQKGAAFKDPELDAARKRAGAVKAMGELEEQPGSAQYYYKAAKLLREAGDDRGAIEFALAGGKAEREEAALKAKAGVAARKERMARIEKLPPNLRTGVMASDPETLAEYAGIPMDDPRFPEVMAQAQRVHSTNIAKQEKAINDLGKLPSTKTTETDVKQFDRLLREKGVGPNTNEGWFGWDNPEEADQRATGLTKMAQMYKDRAKQLGVSVDDNMIVDAIGRYGQATGALQGKWGKDITDFDYDRFNAEARPLIEEELFGAPLDQLDDKQERESPPSGNTMNQDAPSKRRRVSLVPR